MTLGAGPTTRAPAASKDDGAHDAAVGAVAAVLGEITRRRDGARWTSAATASAGAAWQDVSRKATGRGTATDTTLTRRQDLAQVATRGTTTTGRTDSTRAARAAVAFAATAAAARREALGFRSEHTGPTAR